MENRSDFVSEEPTELGQETWALAFWCLPTGCAIMDQLENSVPQFPFLLGQGMGLDKCFSNCAFWRGKKIPLNCNRRF